MTAIHQGAGQRACCATYEEVLGGQAPPSEATGRCGKKQNTATTTGIHQTGGSIEDEELHDLPSLQRQTSQQLVFSIRPVCKEHKPVVVICEA